MTNPRFLTIDLADANTSYSLLTLLQAADTLFDDITFQSCRRLTLQADFDAGATRFFIGNSDLSATVFGVELVATQVVLYEDDGDTINLGQIYVRANAATQIMHIVVQFR